MSECTMCGEREGTIKRADPNLDMNEDIDWADAKTGWMVCSGCDFFISNRMKYMMADMMGHEDMKQKYDKELEEKGTEFMSVQLQKKEDVL